MEKTDERFLSKEELSWQNQWGGESRPKPSSSGRGGLKKETAAHKERRKYKEDDAQNLKKTKKREMRREKLGLRKKKN